MASLPCPVCGASALRFVNGVCPDCNTRDHYIAGEDLRVGWVYVGPDGKVYNYEPKLK